MNEVSQAAYLNTASTYQNVPVKKKEEKTSAAQTQAADGKKEVKGAGTYGNPKLSDKALDYYNSLKKKYGNLNFVLVSSDKKQEADNMKGSFAKSGSLTVLIDTDKIERMAEDKTYRSQIEGTIANAASGISQLAARIGKTSSVASYGMTTDKSGTVSYFAVMKKSSVAQKERMKKKAAKKKEAEKAEEKKTEKQEKEERLDEKRTQAQEESSDTVTLTADSIEGLLQKIKDYDAYGRSHSIQSEAEKYIGQSVDYRL